MTSITKKITIELDHVAPCGSKAKVWNLWIYDNDQNPVFRLYLSDINGEALKTTLEMIK